MKGREREKGGGLRQRGKERWIRFRSIHGGREEGRVWRERRMGGMRAMTSKQNDEADRI